MEHDIGEGRGAPSARTRGAQHSRSRNPTQTPRRRRPSPRSATRQAPSSGAADSLQLFLADVGRHKLLTAAEEVALAKRIERGDPVAKRVMIESNLRLVVSIAKGYRGWAFHSLDLIRKARLTQPRSREVRLAPRVQVLDLRDVVDPPVGAAGRGEPCEDDSRARSRGRASAEALARRAPTRGGARP